MYAFFQVFMGMWKQGLDTVICSQFLEEGEQKSNDFWKRLAKIELSISLL